VRFKARVCDEEADAMRKMPIGIQEFETIVRDKCVYVDKTEWIYRLAKEGNFYFLGRPRRFGKSLLLSTLRAYFEGKKELFRGLAIEGLEKEWVRYPVLHMDLNVAAYRNVDDLYKGIGDSLQIFEEKWGIDSQGALVSTRFLNLIRRAYEKFGRKVVVLVDEYDRPLLQTMENGGTQDEMRQALKGIYGVLKSAGQWLRFVMLTGVTKFSKVSVFSDLNMLRDVSLEEAYAGICGISEEELERDFKPELDALAGKRGETYDEVVAEMKKRYDGYCFAKEGERMFNPFSVLNTLAKQDFAYYWFKTGTPTFLIEQMKRSDFDLLEFVEGVEIPAESIDDYRADGGDPIPLLYQSGYLTIVGYDRGLDEYFLNFPNEEVQYGFLKELIPYYTYGQRGQRFFAGHFVKDLRAGDVDGFMGRMKAFFADIPYELNDQTERHYQVVFYLVFVLMGQFIQAEAHNAKGRADAVAATEDSVYVFEFKLNGTAEEALRQIEEKGYAAPYGAGSRKVVKVGVEFDKAERNISRWLARS
jgi:hypothetical protein